MTQSPQPLVIRTRLFPDESLPSLLVRLTKLNLYEALAILKGVIFDGFNELKPLKDNIELPLKPATYERLMSLSQVDILSLYMATPHRFVPVFALLGTAPTMQLLGQTALPFFPQRGLPKQLRLRHASQFCPQCLKEEAYHNMKWVPIAISTCLRHECLLVDRCDKCNQEVSALDVTRAQCKHCKADLSEIRTCSIAMDGLGLLTQRIITSWFMELITPPFAQSLLPQQPIALLYKVIEDVQLSISEWRGNIWPYMHQPKLHHLGRTVGNKGKSLYPSPYESYQLYTTALKSLLNWPEGFYEFIDNYRNQYVLYSSLDRIRCSVGLASCMIQGPLPMNLGKLYSQCLLRDWNDDNYKFIRETFNAYIADHYWFGETAEVNSFCRRNPDLAERCLYVCLADAAQMLEISLEDLEYLLGSDEVRCQDDEQGRIKFVKKEKVFSLARNQEAPTAIQGGVSRLGLGEHIIKSLVRMGLFSEGENQWSEFGLEEFTSIGETLFLKKVLAHTRNIVSEALQGEGYYLTITEAARLFSIANLDTSTLFLRIITGKLQAYAPEVQPYRLGQLLFTSHDIQKIVTDHVNSLGILLDQDEAASVLGVSNEIFARWVRKGLFVPEGVCANKLYFEKAEIDVFVKMHTFGKEVLQEIGLETGTFENLLQEAPLSLIKICVRKLDLRKKYLCVFPREALSNWRSQRFTFDEAKKLLNVDGATLYKWTKEGVIQGVDYLNGEPRWFLKQELLGLVSEDQSLVSGSKMSFYQN